MSKKSLWAAPKQKGIGRSECLWPWGKEIVSMACLGKGVMILICLLLFLLLFVFSISFF
jgi:hypothetical protein